MRVIDHWKPTLDYLEFQNGTRLPSMTVPGLAISMEDVLKRIAAGTQEMSPEARKEIYSDKKLSLSDYSPRVDRMSLAEKAQVIRDLRAELTTIEKRVSKRRESEEKAKKEQERAQLEASIREQLSRELPNNVNSQK